MTEQARKDLELLILWEIMDATNPFIEERGPRMDTAKSMLETAVFKWFSEMTTDNLVQTLMKLKTADLEG